MKSEKVLFKNAFFFKKVLDLLLGEAFFQFAQRDPEHVLDGLDRDGEGVCNFLLFQSLDPCGQKHLLAAPRQPVHTVDQGNPKLIGLQRGLFVGEIRQVGIPVQTLHRDL